MVNAHRVRALLSVGLLCSGWGITLVHAAANPVDPAVLGRIRDSAMQDNWSYAHLEELTDGVGPR